MIADVLIRELQSLGGYVRLDAQGKVKAAIPPGAENLLSRLREHKPEITSVLRNPIPSREADIETFHKWAINRCRYKDRCFGEIADLHSDFGEWSVNHDYALCSRDTFEQLLKNAGFFFADGLVSGLILAADLSQEEANRLRPTEPDEQGRIVIEP